MAITNLNTPGKLTMRFLSAISIRNGVVFSMACIMAGQLGTALKLTKHNQSHPEANNRKM